MNKEFITLSVIIFALFVAGLNYTGLLHIRMLNVLNGTKNLYIDSVEALQSTIDKHFNQAHMIETLQAENMQYQQDRLFLESIASEYSELLAAHESRLTFRTNVILARAISYAKFGERSKVWLEIPHYNPEKMYGLVVDGKSAGIVIERLGRPMALLNSDLKTSYAVYIGQNEVPGIVRGKKSDEMVVEFVPTWMKIKVGDEVFTSGLDKLFYKGIAVGRVISVAQKQGYQVANLMPYANTERLGYLFVIEQLD